MSRVNTETLMQVIRSTAFGVYGLSGSVYQRARVRFFNDSVLSKLWYVSQSVHLDVQMLEEVDKMGRDMVYRGHNERPVQQLSYRKVQDGGLGLIKSGVKCQALFYKAYIKNLPAVRGMDGNVDDYRINKLLL